jgi:hypothetical protein
LVPVSGWAIRTYWDVFGYGGKGRGLVVAPSSFGVELFLYAMGEGHLPINMFLLPQVTFDSIEGLTIPDDCISLGNAAQTAEARRIVALTEDVSSPT